MKETSNAMPEISVVMSVYNPESRNQTFVAIKSILRQSFQNFEFIIYDDGSDPLIAAAANNVKKLDSRIIVVGKEENRGLAFSLNECIKLARGKYIARMDADDISLPDRLQKQYVFLESHKEYLWCGCNAELIDDEGIWAILKCPEKPQKEDFLKFSPFIHPSVMFRKELFDDGIRYHVSEETLRCEDYELFMRLHQIGYRGYNLQECLFQYRENRNTLKKQKMKFRINEAKLRYKNFREMGLLNIKGWLYVFRPIAGGLIPTKLLVAYKWRRYKNENS